MINQEIITALITKYFNMTTTERLSLSEVQDLMDIIYNTAYDIKYNKDLLKDTVKLCYELTSTDTDTTADTSIHTESTDPETEISAIANTNIMHTETIAVDTSTDVTCADALKILRSRELVGDQRTADWLARRQKYITASISAACSGLMGQAARLNYLLEKATEGKYKNFTGSCHTDKGNIFEPVTNTIYCIRNKTHIHAFGLIPSNDPDYDFLAASTDGVTSSLVNIEIKTLASRVLDGKIKKEYWHQMQHQMFCLGLKVSHFLEAKYDEYKDIDELIRAVGSTPKATVGAIIEKYEEDEGYTYEYSPIYDMSDAKTLTLWEDTKKKTIYNEAPLYIRTIFYHLTDYNQQTVKYSKTWITTVGPVLQKFWLEVHSLKHDQKRLSDLLQSREIKSSQKKDLFKDCQL